MDMVYEISKLANDLYCGDAASLVDLIERVNGDPEIWGAIEEAITSEGMEEMAERFEELLAGHKNFSPSSINLRGSVRKLPNWLNKPWFVGV